jgi:hypothetical protein
MLHRTVFYYENNEYLVKYTSSISVLPKDAAAPAGSLAMFFLSLFGL